MAKICTSCGLTTDSDGNLIVDVNDSAWPLTACAYTSGTPIYCGTDGALRGPAEKFSQFNRIGKNFITENGITTDSQPNRMTHWEPTQSGVLTDISSDGNGTANGAGGKAPLTFTIPNPSKCLPFYVYMEAGISHAYVHYEGNPGSFTFEASAFITVTGALQNFTGHTGHQIWGFDTHGTHEEIVFDSMGARATVDPNGSDTKFTIAAGGTITVKLNPFIAVDLSGTSTVADIKNLTMDVNWWGSSDV